MPPPSEVSRLQGTLEADPEGRVVATLSNPVSMTGALQARGGFAGTYSESSRLSGTLNTQVDVVATIEVL